MSVPDCITQREERAQLGRVRLADVTAAALDLPAGTEGVVCSRLAPFGPYLVAVADIADDYLILDEDEFTWLTTAPVTGAPTVDRFAGRQPWALGSAA